MPPPDTRERQRRVRSAPVNTRSFRGRPRPRFPTTSFFGITSFGIFVTEAGRFIVTTFFVTGIFVTETHRCTYPTITRFAPHFGHGSLAIAFLPSHACEIL